MIRRLIAQYNCSRGRHKRLKRVARKVEGEDRYVSRCAHCDAPMERVGDGPWVLRPLKERPRAGMHKRARSNADLDPNRAK